MAKRFHLAVNIVFGGTAGNLPWSYGQKLKFIIDFLIINSFYIILHQSRLIWDCLNNWNVYPQQLNLTLKKTLNTKDISRSEILTTLARVSMKWMVI